MDLQFELRRGREHNFFLRQGQNQSHTAITSGQSAALVIAFPAGNMCGALFFDGTESLEFRVTVAPEAVSGRESHGVRLALRASTNKIYLRAILLGSVRDAREYEYHAKQFADARPTEVVKSPDERGFRRSRLDKAGDYALTLRVRRGQIKRDGERWLLDGGDYPVEFEVEVLNSETPLTPLDPEDIFRAPRLQHIDRETLQAAAFLSCREKLLAGSWRYLTYFGRDPLLTQLYAMEFFGREGVEAVLSAVLARLNPAGDAAHEEAIGDWATRENLGHGRGATNAPVFDYQMMDTAFLTAIHAHAYINNFGLCPAAEFFRAGVRATALRRNFALILERAAPFAADPVFTNLIAFPAGRTVGDWRDSSNGHGAPGDAEVSAQRSRDPAYDPTITGGRYSFGINVALVPAALRAVAEILNAGVLDAADRTAADRKNIDCARAALAVWERAARPLFRQTVSAELATARARAVARELGLPAPPACAAPFSYAALSLDARGEPIRALHSDIGFDLLFNSPDAATLREVAAHFLLPQGYGLTLPVGMLIVNPFLIEDDVMRRRFDRREYHGSVVWGCEMAKVERGLAHQLRRPDLAPAVRAELELAHRRLWQLLEQTRAHRREELWSWDVVDGEITYAPYAAANVLQLWNLALSLLENPYAPTSSI